MKLITIYTKNEKGKEVKKLHYRMSRVEIDALFLECQRMMRKDESLGIYGPFVSYVNKLNALERVLILRDEE